MQRTTAPNSSGGLHVDKIPGSVVGTTGIALDRNNLQEEIVNSILQGGLSLSASQDQLAKALAAFGYPVGRRIESFVELTPGTYCPVVRIDDADHDIDTTHYLALVTALRAIKAKVNGTTDFAGTVAGSVFTFTSTTAADRMLAVLTEEQLYHATFTAWLCINIAGTDYAITGINAGARTVTVTGTPTSGAQTGIIYPYRIAGSSTTARLRRDSGAAFTGSKAETTDGVVDALQVPGMRVRNRGQGHRHSPLSPATQFPVYNGSGSSVYQQTGGSFTPTTSTTPIGDPTTDTVNGIPRVGTTSRGDQVTGYIYMGAGIYN